MMYFGLGVIAALILAILGLPWGLILSVLGLGAIIVGAMNIYSYKDETGMIVAMVVLLIIPGIFMLLCGMSIGY